MHPNQTKFELSRTILVGTQAKANKWHTIATHKERQTTAFELCVSVPGLAVVGREQVGDHQQ